MTEQASPFNQSQATREPHRETRLFAPMTLAFTR